MSDTLKITLTPELDAHLRLVVEEHFKKPGRFTRFLEITKNAGLAMARERVERRVKRLYLRPGQILELLNLNVPVSTPDQATNACIVQFAGLPEGTKAVSVHHEFTRNAWCVTVEHPSFADVPDAEIAPEIPGFTRLIVKRTGPDLRTMNDFEAKGPVPPFTRSEAIREYVEAVRAQAGPNPTQWIDDFFAGKFRPAFVESSEPFEVAQELGQSDQALNWRQVTYSPADLARTYRQAAEERARSKWEALCDSAESKAKHEPSGVFEHNLAGEKIPPADIGKTGVVDHGLFVPKPEIQAEHGGSWRDRPPLF